MREGVGRDTTQYSTVAYLVKVRHAGRCACQNPPRELGHIYHRSLSVRDDSLYRDKTVGDLRTRLQLHLCLPSTFSFLPVTILSNST